MRLVVAYIVALAACRGSEAAESVDLGPRPDPATKTVRSEPINPRLLRRFRPLEPAPEPANEADVAKIALGRQLFFDPRLSRGGKASCQTCHLFDRGGADPRPTSIGADGRPGKRNAPTVWNAAAHVAQFWDGREHDLEQQAGSPILDPDEMGMGSSGEVTTVLRSIPGYQAEFTAAFGPGTVDFAHAKLAIAAFERTLRTPSRWDSYLQGDRSALTAAELEGLKVFSDTGCIECHTGELIGGSMFRKVGVEKPWPNQTDPGRFAVTHLEADRMVFKVPSLRNVTLTAPYFHDGSVPTLAAAVKMMAEHQIGTTLDDREVTAIVTWLGSLAGTPPPVTGPDLPPDGPTTGALVNAH